MKAKNPTTHAVIENTLNVYQRERSAIWQCAFKIDKKWQRQSTNTRDLKEAKERAPLTSNRLFLYESLIWV